jgi:hypothetical protein
VVHCQRYESCYENKESAAHVMDVTWNNLKSIKRRLKSVRSNVTFEDCRGTPPETQLTVRLRLLLSSYDP